jgi:hypothetical protein
VVRSSSTTAAKSKPQVWSIPAPSPRQCPALGLHGFDECRCALVPGSSIEIDVRPDDLRIAYLGRAEDRGSALFLIGWGVRQPTPGVNMASHQTELEVPRAARGCSCIGLAICCRW